MIIINSMLQLTDIHYIIWDLDGTLYPFTPEMDEDCVIAAAKAAIELGFSGPQDIAENLARQGFQEAHNGIEIFVERYGLPLADLHEAYHSHITINHISPYNELIALMHQSPHTHAILTHGSKNWAKRILNQRHLSEFFCEEHIIGMEDYQFYKKHTHYEPFKQVLFALGNAPASQAIIIEDSARNLIIPHDMGMKTALLLDPNNKYYDKPDYVDLVIHSPEAFLKILLQES